MEEIDFGEFDNRNSNNTFTNNNTNRNEEEEELVLFDFGRKKLKEQIKVTN